MAERRLYQQFKEKITKADPNCWVYKIPDTFKLGGKKPFDFFLLIQGVAFAIEFKSENEPLTRYQAYQLSEFLLAGGEALSYWENQKSIDDLVSEILGKIKRRKGVKQ